MAGESVDVRLYNIVMLGLSFMLIFTAFQTASMAEVKICYNLRNLVMVFLPVYYARFVSKVKVERQIPVL